MSEKQKKRGIAMKINALQSMGHRNIYLIQILHRKVTEDDKCAMKSFRPQN